MKIEKYKHDDKNIWKIAIEVVIISQIRWIRTSRFCSHVARSVFQLRGMFRPKSGIKSFQRIHVRLLPHKSRCLVNPGLAGHFNMTERAKRWCGSSRSC